MTNSGNDLTLLSDAALDQEWYYANGHAWKKMADPDRLHLRALAKEKCKRDAIKNDDT
jgi:hypothetical protein